MAARRAHGGQEAARLAEHDREDVAAVAVALREVPEAVVHARPQRLPGDAARARGPRQRWGRPHTARLAVRPGSRSQTLKVQTAVRHEHAASLRQTLFHMRLNCHASGQVALGPRQTRASVQGAGAHFWVCCEMDGG